MAAPDPFTLADFSELMAKIPQIQNEERLAVAVSGGPDSMALAHLLSAWAKECNKHIVALTVDHALRAESADEAKQVGEWLGDMPNITHATLAWEGEKPDSRIMEEARLARYHLMQSYLKNETIRFLFIGHHMDDQAETFLIRLAKGSGLDGLSAMKPLQDIDGDVTLVRPLLDVSKNQLKTYCIENKVPFVKDPSNENADYLRPRLRQSKAALEEEGLSSKRLSMTAKRMRRARTALEELSDTAFQACLKEKTDESLIFDLDKMRSQPDEIILRMILKAIGMVGKSSAYGPRMEKAESLMDKITNQDKGKETLGGCIFTFSAEKANLKVEKEHL